MPSHDLTFGVFVPQGWKMELASIEDPQAKWAKAVEIAQLAEELGFDSLWVYDHFHNVPRPGARDDVRVLDDAGRDQPAHLAHQARPDGRVRAVPQPGAAGEDHLEHRRDVGRPPHLGRRRRLVPARVHRLRLRVPGGGRPHPRAARDRRDREGDVVRARRQLRRAGTSRSRARSATRSRCSSRTPRSSSAAAASSSRCGWSPATPTPRTSAASPTSGSTRPRCSSSTARTSAATTTRSARRSRPRCSSARPSRRSSTPARARSGASRPSRGGPATSSGTPEQVAEKVQGLRRPRLHRLLPVVQRLPGHRDRSAVRAGGGPPALNRRTSSLLQLEGLDLEELLEAELAELPAVAGLLVAAERRHAG